MHFLFKRISFYSYITLFYSLSNHIKIVQSKKFFKRSLLRFLTFALLLKRIRCSLLSSNLKEKYSNFPTLQIKKFLIITLCVCVLQDKMALIGIGAGPVVGPEGQLWFIGVEFDVLFITVLQATDNSFKIFEFQPLYVYLNAICNK